MHRTLVLSVTLGVSLALLAAGPALAKKKRRIHYWTEYAVPFACGANAADFSNLLPGDYATSAQLLNTGAAPVDMQLVVALTNPPGMGQAGSTSDVVQIQVPARAGLQFGCDDLLQGFVFADPFVPAGTTQGYLIVRAYHPLNVQATHTASSGLADSEVSIDVEPIAGRNAHPPAPLSGSVEVCHAPPGNPSNAHTIRVDASSVPAHQGHGDTLGACAP